MDGEQIQTYSLISNNNDITAISTTSLNIGFLNVVLTQEQVVTKERYRRNAVAGTFLLIGAFISMITRITNLLLGKYQGFSIDKSMIKKLYSYKPPRGSQLNSKNVNENNEGFD